MTVTGHVVRRSNFTSLKAHSPAGLQLLFTTSISNHRSVPSTVLCSLSREGTVEIFMVVGTVFSDLSLPFRDSYEPNPRLRRYFTFADRFVRIFASLKIHTRWYRAGTVIREAVRGESAEQRGSKRQR